MGGDSGGECSEGEDSGSEDSEGEDSGGENSGEEAVRWYFRAGCNSR